MSSKRTTWTLAGLMAVVGCAWLAVPRPQAVAVESRPVQVATAAEVEQRQATVRLAAQVGVEVRSMRRKALRRDGQSVQSQLRVEAAGEAGRVSAFVNSLATAPAACVIDRVAVRCEDDAAVATVDLTVRGVPTFRVARPHERAEEIVGGPPRHLVARRRPGLSQIFYGRRTCVIDGQIKRAGQFAGPWRIEAVLPDVVVLVHGADVIELHPGGNAAGGDS